MHYKCHSTSICRFWGQFFTFRPLSSVIFMKVGPKVTPSWPLRCIKSLKSVGKIRVLVFWQFWHAKIALLVILACQNRHFSDLGIQEPGFWRFWHSKIAIFGDLGDQKSPFCQFWHPDIAILVILAYQNHHFVDFGMPKSPIWLFWHAKIAKMAIGRHNMYEIHVSYGIINHKSRKNHQDYKNQYCKSRAWNEEFSIPSQRAWNEEFSIPIDRSRKVLPSGVREEAWNTHIRG